MATRIVFTSRAKAAQWASVSPTGLVGQIKRGKGPPTKAWEQLGTNMDPIPDGQPWLLRRGDGALARVCFDRNADSDAAYGAARASKMLSEMVDSVERVTGIVSSATRMQTEISNTLLQLQARMAEISERQDKTMSEVIKASSVHKLVENVFARLMSYIARKDGTLSPDDAAMLEKVMLAMAEKRAADSVSQVCASVGVSVETEESETSENGTASKIPGNASESVGSHQRRTYPRRPRNVPGQA